MKTTHLVASELFLVFLLAGCANLPTDQACRAGIEKEVKVFDANGHVMRYHRSWDFPFLLSAAEVDEWGGDYQSCLNNLKMARVNRHTYRRFSGNYYGTQNTYSWGGQNPSMGSMGSANDAAHHAAGHTHHHGHN